MKPLYKDPTADTPFVQLDAERNIFEISAMSLPEDAIEFYAPVIDWLEQYKQHPNSYTVFVFKLEYFNTASSKQLIQIMLILQEIAKNHDVLIKWYYKEIDEDMQAIGEEYSQVIKVKFELVSF